VTETPIEEVEERKWELEDVLLHDYGVQSFKKFLESEFTAEYMLFLEAVDALYEIPDRMISSCQVGLSDGG
jgi:hypothetical protein